jgi:hypothetical protein
MNDLIQRIQELSREEALEAAGFVGKELTSASSPSETEKDLLKPLTIQPYQNIEELEQLARLMLITGASMPEFQETIRKAVEGAGQKQFILGGAEIVVLSVLALGALHVIVSKGRESEEEVIKIEEKDGKTSITIRKKVRYGIGTKLGSILKDYFASLGQ